MSDQGAVVQRALLVGELTRLRKEQGFTQGNVAEALDWSQAKLMRIEGGKQSVTRTDLEALLRHYQVNDEAEVERILSLSKGANRPAWWDKYRGHGIKTDYLKLVGYEAGASDIRSAQNSLVPGLLQTREYIEVMAREITREQARTGPGVDLRMERQQRMWEREKPPHQVYVLDEAVIRRHVGISVDPGIMPTQLRRLAELNSRAEVDIHVIPFSTGAHRGMREPFMVLGFEGDLDDILYLERSEGQPFIEDRDQVSDYNVWFTELVDQALSVDDSAALILEVAEQMLT